jgi:4-hydroxy-4-methyl-2-oxoglutarate aldolase
MDDTDLLTTIERDLYSAVIGDILDAQGYRHQFLPAELKPLQPDMVVAGRAMPVLMMDVFDLQEKPFGLMTEALDDLKPGEIYVASGAFHRSATWGEIMTAAARSRGARGAVLDGYHRDTLQVLAQAFPVFSRGAWAQDSGPRMKVSDFRCAIEIATIRIEPGDLLFADRDGVVVIPRAVEQDVLRKALEKAKTEKVVRKAIESGMGATEAFHKYGVL